MNKNRITLFSLVLDAVLIVIWLVNVAVDVIFKTADGISPWLLVLHILCVVLWTIAFVLNLARYREAKREPKA